MANVIASDVTIAGDKTFSGDIIPSSPLSHRNLIINGAMQVSQRGTSSTGQGASTIFLLDRFKLQTNGNSAGRYTVTQESITDLPGFAKAMKLSCTTADTSIAAAERFFIGYSFEGQDVQLLKKGTSSAEKVTLSFYVKGNAAATYVVGFYDVGGRNIGKQFSVTTSWNRVSITFDGDTSNAPTNDNSEQLVLRFYLHAGSNYTGGTLQQVWDTTTNNETVGGGTTSFFDSTNRTFFITGVQLELGENATPFEHRFYGEVADQCYRYYQKFEPTTAQGADTKTQAGNLAFILVPFLKPMRSSASFSVTGNFSYYNGSSWVSATTSGGASDTSAFLYLNVGTNGLASGSPSAWYIRSNSQKIILDSEL